jgi:hypothetical protein
MHIQTFIISFLCNFLLLGFNLVAHKLFFHPTQFSFVNAPFFPTHNFIIPQFLISTIDFLLFQNGF